MFVVGADVLHQVGSGTILCFAAAVVVGLAVAAIYAELGSAFPHAGGEYTLVGRVLGPGAAFAILACVLPGTCIGAALCALGTASYVGALWPAHPPGLASLAIVVATLISLRSIRFNALLTGSVLAIEMATLAALAVLGFTHAHGNWLALMAHPVRPGPAGLAPVPLPLLGVGAAAGLYAFNGYGTVVYFGEEIHRARWAVGGVVYAALGIAVLAEMLPLAGVLAGAADFAALARSPTPIAAFVRATGGPVMAALLSAGVALALFNTLIAVILTCARQIFATARDRSWPEAASRALFTTGRHGAPAAATLLVGACALLLVHIPESTLIVVDGEGNVALYAMLAIAVMVGRHTGATAGSQARMPAFPLAPVFALLALAGVAWTNWLDTATGRLALAITAALLAAGAIYWRACLRRKAAWSFRDPADEAASQPAAAALHSSQNSD